MHVIAAPAALVVVAWTLLYHSWLVSALPEDAGGCAGDRAAVGEGHLTNTANGGPTNGTLAEGSRVLIIGLTPYTDPTETIDLVTGLTYDISARVIGTTSGKLRGALLRVECHDTDEFVVEGDGNITGQPAEICAAPVQGVTHITRDEKTKVSGFLTVDFNTACQLDVTVVDSNNDIDGSVYWYSQFQLIFAGGEDPPTAAPAGDPTAAPADSPTVAPAVTPTAVPSPAPTEAPIPGTREPSPALLPVPTVVAPSVIPTPAPSPAPLTSPTVLPSLVPKPAPSHAPTDAPSPAPNTDATIMDSPTVAPMDASKVAKPGDWCFSSHAIVQVRGKGAIPMEELQIGDFVLVSGSSGSDDAPGNSSSSGSSNSYSMVYSFGHNNPDQPTEYLQIQVVEDALEEAKKKNDQYHPLEISKEHLLFIHNPHTQKQQVIPAGKVKVGDWITTENHAVPAQVDSITKVYRRGAYSPLTTQGTIVVSGVLASNYVSRTWLMDVVPGQVMHWLQHGAIVPYRLYCSLLGSSCVAETYDSETGFSPWVLFWYRLEQWQLGIHPALQMGFLLLLAVPALATMLVGALLMTPWNATTATHLLACWLGYYAWRKVHQPNTNAHFTDKDLGPEKTTINGAVLLQ